ncbi:uncharacterized [Tachysurus ichikawai]
MNPTAGATNHCRRRSSTEKQTGRTDEQPSEYSILTYNTKQHLWDDMDHNYSCFCRNMKAHPSCIFTGSVTWCVRKAQAL